MDPRARLAAVLGTCAVAALVIWAGTATSCATPAEEPRSPSERGPREDTCEQAIAPSTFAPRAPDDEPKVPPSRLVIELAVAETALERILDARIPKGLGSASRQPIGAPGEVTYTVSRGAPDATLAGDTLEVKVPIHAAVEICKPIGRLCPTYGACQPNLVATTRVPLRLDEDYGIEPPKVEVRVTRGCRIAGFDVTDEVQRAAAGARRRAERQIAMAIPDLRATMTRATGLLSRPVAVGQDRCLRITPEAISQGAPTSRKGMLETSFEVRGTVEPTPCDARFPSPTLPPLGRFDGRVAPSELVTREPLAADVLEILKPSAPAGVEVRLLRIAPHRTPAGPRLALEVELEGRACGTLWAIAAPSLEEGRLVLDGLEATSPQNAPVLDGIRWETEGVVADDLARRLARRAREASAAVDLDGVELDAAVDVAEVSARADVTADGIVVTSRARGRLRIVVASPSPR